MPEKTWRCRLGMHKWVLQSGPEGGPFHECARCGKMRSDDPGIPHDAWRET